MVSPAGNLSLDLPSQVKLQALAPAQNTNINRPTHDLQQMFERVITRREKIDPSTLSLAEAVAYAEVETFINAGDPSFSEYLLTTAQIKTLTGELAEELSDPTDIFVALHQIKRAVKLLSVRWQAFTFVFTVRNPSLRTEIERMFTNPFQHVEEFYAIGEQYPEFNIFYAESLFSSFDSLQTLARRLKDILEHYLKEDPSIAKLLLRHWYEHSLPFDDELFDWALGIPPEQYTEADINTVSLREEYGKEQYIYEGTRYQVIRTFAEVLTLGPRDVFYDLGAGYGRVGVVIGATSQTGRIRLVEIAPERVEKPRVVLKNLGMDHATVEQMDVRAIGLENLRDATVFYLFNPFRDETLKEITEKLRALASVKPFRVVAYGQCRLYLEDQRWLRLWKQVGDPFEPVTIFEIAVSSLSVPNLEKAL